jgi:hypothetical protein
LIVQYDILTPPKLELKYMIEYNLEYLDDDSQQQSELEMLSNLIDVEFQRLDYESEQIDILIDEYNNNIINVDIDILITPQNAKIRIRFRIKSFRPQKIRKFQSWLSFSIKINKNTISYP